MYYPSFTPINRTVHLAVGNSSIDGCRFRIISIIDYTVTGRRHRCSPSLCCDITPNSRSSEVNALLLYIRSHWLMSPILLFLDVFLQDVSSILIFVKFRLTGDPAACHLMHNAQRRMRFNQRCHVRRYSFSHSKLIDPMDQSLGNMCMMRDNNSLVMAVLNRSRNKKGCSSSHAFIKRKITCLMSVMTNYI